MVINNFLYKIASNIVAKKQIQCFHQRYYEYRWVESDGALMVYCKCEICGWHDFGLVEGCSEGWAGETYGNKITIDAIHDLTKSNKLTWKKSWLSSQNAWFRSYVVYTTNLEGRKLKFKAVSESWYDCYYLWCDGVQLICSYKDLKSLFELILDQCKK